MLAVQVRAGRERDEELRTVRVRPGVRHRQDPCSSVLELIFLVVESIAIDASSASPGPRRVSTLNHEVTNDAMEYGAVEVIALRQGHEVLACARGVSSVQLDGERAKRRLDLYDLRHAFSSARTSRLALDLE